MNELLSLYMTHTGKVADRWLAYLEQYDLLFAGWRDKPVRLLEIGVQNGGSLEIWGRYFSKASILIGCDIDPLCGNLTFDDSRIRVVIGDASSDDIERRLTSYSPTWDIVIDDGSHHSRHIVDSFFRFFPRISAGGMFVAEDLHCSYWREFDGGLLDPLSPIALFKRLADIVNFEHWGIPTSRTEYLADFAKHYGFPLSEEALAQVHAVEFVNSQCIVFKRKASDNNLGQRLVVGAIEQVSAGVKKFNGTKSDVPDQVSNPWSSTKMLHLVYANRAITAEALAADPNAQLSPQVPQPLGSEAHILRRNETVSVREHKLPPPAEDKVPADFQHFHKHDLHTTETPAILLATIQSRDRQIAELLAAQLTTSARVARLITRVTKKALPAGSLRRQIFARILGFADHVYRHGLIGALHVDRAAGGDASQLQGVVTVDAMAKPPQFAAWIRAHEPNNAEMARQRLASAPYNPKEPLFSIITPVYKIPRAVLEATIASARNQTWQNWEMCIAYADIENTANWALLEQLAAEEPRLQVRRLRENGGISRNSNAALAFARGQFVTLLDHDDELTPWALHDMAARIAAAPDVDFLYSDKDSINAGGTLRQNPLFKPTWSPEMMLSVNYLTHLNVMRRSIVQAVGGWNPDTDGAQDWDIFFRVTEKARRIERVPGIHYHWRIIAGSTATGISAKPYALLGQLRAFEMHIQRLGLPASVQPDLADGYHLKWHLDDRPGIDVVLHGECDNLSSITQLLVEQCDNLVASITLSWCGLGNPPAPPTTLPSGIPFTITRAPAGNKTAAIADAVAIGNAPAVLLLDVAVKHLAPHSLLDLAGWVLQHPEIGFSSALVLCNDETVVEAGRVVGLDGATQPLFQGMPLRHWGLFGGPLWYRNVSAAGDTAITFKRDRLQLSKYRETPWQRAIVSICIDARGSDRRGVVVPRARAFVDQIPPLSHVWHDSMRDDPYFHPAFKSVVPLELDTKQ